MDGFDVTSFIDSYTQSDLMNAGAAAGGRPATAGARSSSLDPLIGGDGDDDFFDDEFDEADAGLFPLRSRTYSV